MKLMFYWYLPVSHITEARL